MARVPTPSERRARHQIELWRRQVQGAVAKINNIPADRVQLPRSESDCFRMLNWKSWSIQYNVDLEFILRTLLQYFSKIRRPGPGLGVAITSLTGSRAREVIQERVLTLFPTGENRDIARSNLQAQMTDTSRPVKIHSTDIDIAVAQYSRTMKSRQQRRLEAKRKLSRRPWRNNPWR